MSARHFANPQSVPTYKASPVKPGIPPKSNEASSDGSEPSVASARTEESSEPPAYPTPWYFTEAEPWFPAIVRDATGEWVMTLRGGGMAEQNDLATRIVAAANRGDL